MPGRVFLCDPSLRSFSGHCYGYFRPVQTLLESQGRTNFLVGNRQQDAHFHAATGAIPAFTYWCDERDVGQDGHLSTDANADAIRAAHEIAIFTDLTRMDEEFGFRSDDLMIINTLRHWSLRGVIDFLDSLSLQRAPKVSIISLFSSEPELGVETPAVRHYRDAFGAFERSPRRDRVRFFADADTLIEEYAELTKLTVHLAPFPQEPPGKISKTDQDNLTVAYIGEAREHKGFHLLPFLANRLAEQGYPVRLEVQCHIHDITSAFYQRSMATLSRSRIVKLWTDPLSEVEFDELIDRADIILLPYGVGHYHRQTSAVFALAATRGTPVVASRGTWMARRVKETGAGELCNPNDFIDFSGATIRLIDHYSTRRAAALAASGGWREFNNVENFVQVVDWV